MTATAPPRKRKRNGRRLMFILGGVILLLAALAAAAFALAPRSPAPGTLPIGWQLIKATSGSIAATVSATGNVEPQAEANLRFAASGTVAVVLVKPGDTLLPDQPLARIDTAGLQLQVEQAQADLRQAQADLEALLAGATAQEIAEAKARVAQARSQYTQTASSVSQADLAAARADLEAAKARLARLVAGPANDTLASATQQVQSAQTNLDNARASLSAAKEQARLNLATRANALRNAQDEYSRIYWENIELDKLPGDLPQTRKDQEAQAQRAVADAETALRTAQTAYEQAKLEEINTLAAREADLQSAIEARTKVLKGTQPEDLADARAAVQRAQAKLTQLTGTQRQSELAAQAANITIAQAGLDKLLADPSINTLTSRQAAVARAEVAVKSAQRNLALGTLTAPFAATVAQVDLRVGEPADGTAGISVVDLSSFHIDLPVDELDIAQVQPGQRVRIELDALPGQTFGGTVTNIAPLATRSSTGTTTYTVTVTLDPGSTGVRPGMTAVVEVVTQEKQNVVLVTRRAVRAEGGQSFVLVPTVSLTPQPTTAAQTAALPGERRPVTIGLSNSEFVEIVSGLSAGEQVFIQDVVSTFNPSGPPQ